MNIKSITQNFFRVIIRPWGLITATGFIICVATVLGFLGAYYWVFDLFSHFRVQYFLGLCVVSMLLLFPRKRRSAALFGVLAVVNLIVILPLYSGITHSVVIGRYPIRAMLANVNTQFGNPTEVATAIRRYNPDIIVLEEISDKWLSDLKPVLDGYRYTEQEPREDNFGIGLWSKHPFTRSQIVYIGKAGVPSLVVEIATTQGPCTVVATHPLPPAGKAYSAFRNGQLAELPRWVRQASSPVVLLGDLNVTPWNHFFKRLLDESGLQDSSQGRGVCATWPTRFPLLRIPIDHCLYSKGIEIGSKRSGPFVGSDHFPIVVDFRIQYDTR